MPHPLKLMPMFRALLVCGLLLTPVQAQDLLRHQLSSVPEARLESMTLALQAPDQGVEQAEILRHLSSGRASVSMANLFSSQQGSWPFEPFVHNGLFRVIAGYQPHHPQVVLLRGGSITLAQLHRALGNERVMSKHKDGYLLSYPLQIAADAALNITDSTLYLRQESGTALINQGELNLQQATLTGWGTGEDAQLSHGFRPFVIAWAGSRTRIVDSQLHHLGYNAHLARGLTLARSAQQAPGLAPASLLLRGSRVSQLASGVELHQALARIEDNRFADLQHHALDLEDSRASLIGNQIRRVKHQSAIRLRGASPGVIERNVILGAGKAGIEVREQQGDLILRQNIIGAAQSSGILLRQISALPGARLLLAQNHIANTQGSGIDAEAVDFAHLVGNRIDSTPEYAISFRNSPQRPSHLVVMGNQMMQTGKAMIRTEGIERVVLGNNHYQMARNSQPLLAGDLMPVQSLLMEATLQHPCIVEVLIGAKADPGDGLPVNCRGG